MCCRARPAAGVAASPFLKPHVRLLIGAYSQAAYTTPKDLRRYSHWAVGDLDASARLRQIRAALGAWTCTLRYLSVVRDQSWAALGRQYRCDPKTARAWVTTAIKAPLRTI